MFMLFLRRCCLAALTFVFLTSSSLNASEKAKSRILMVTQSQGFMHSSVRRPDGTEAEKKTGGVGNCDD